MIRVRGSRQPSKHPRCHRRGGCRTAAPGRPRGGHHPGVAEQAGVQAPTIYRLFGDKDGLLEAVVEHVMATFVSAKASAVEEATAADVDPLEDLRTSWRQQIDFGLANPAVFRLLSDPDRVIVSPAAQAGRQILAARVRRLATTARLRVTEQRAVGLIQAAGIGTIQTLLATPSDERDPELADAMLDAVLARILTDASAETPSGPIATAVALRAFAPQLQALSESERHLLIEWLDRIT
ncbi:TetR/AcrR family transcriptional regulator [Allobranchiibius sp. GilTou73]|uniref:TetR/AcrR family transcriptional regulator n=1 Tax=Allobranchiibius sp. GilTou73 TaxID=2904523 RepID=UPI001F30332B|nr:TetR/AcrR family transcriptional regulator [Allobranchiibius sp. GilTou73]UIJ35310.1 TetR/AcrR family transcriptional regulator [Allobranchiibius sp. GilTou73]